MTRHPIATAEFESLSETQRSFVVSARDWVWENRDISEWLDEPFLHVTLGGVWRVAMSVPRILLDSFRKAVGMPVVCEGVGPYELVVFPEAT